MKALPFPLFSRWYLVVCLLGFMPAITQAKAHVTVHLDTLYNKPRLVLYDAQGQTHTYPIAAPAHTPSCLGTAGATGTVIAIDHHASWRPTYKTIAAAKKKGRTLKRTYKPGERGNAIGGRKIMIAWHGGCILSTVRIHGTTTPHLVRQQARASRGCIRMLNTDWNDLASRISPGTQVHITRS